MAFEFIKTEIPEVILIKPRVFLDERGFFLEFYKESEFKQVGIKGNFVQANHSKSTKGVLRGLHYQLAPKSQGKLIRCIKGRMFDVAVDIRKGSPTFGKYVGVELSEENHSMFWIPQGFAHGFLTLSETVEVIYQVLGAEYAPEYERAVRWNDTDIAINWPLEKEPILSAKDKSAPLLKDAEINFIYGEM
jgi:dTDP-4-dehydrorhamnose 3,5-epimerase